MTAPDLAQQEARYALWEAGILRWSLWEQQLPIYDSIRALPPEIDEPVILCARQFGKSHLGCILAIEDCLRYDDRCILIIGPTLKQTREIVAPRIRRIMQSAPPGLIRPSKSEGKWYIGTSELVIGGMDVNSSAQRGKTVQNVYIEEIVESKPDDYLEALRSDIGPAMTHSDAGKMVFLTTLPKIPDHPFITETMAKAALNGALYIYTIHDNRALSKAQFEACVRRAGGESTDDWKREYLCQIVRDRNLVIIPDFDDKQDVLAFRVPETINLEVFTDWGGVRDLTVSLLMGYDFLTARDLVIDELWHPHNTPTEHIVKTFRAKWGEHDIKRHVVDAPGQLAVDLQSTHGMSISPPQKDDWEASINNLANRFTQRKVKIHPRCKLLIQTCRSGVFNKNRTDFDRSVTLGHMDAVAALMYGVRCLDRTSPFAPEKKQHDFFFVRPDAAEVQMQPALKLVNSRGIVNFGGKK